MTIAPNGESWTAASLLAASALRQFIIIFARAESDYQHYWDLNWAEPEDFDSVLPALCHSSRLDVQLESTLSPMLCVSIWLMQRSSHSMMGPLMSTQLWCHSQVSLIAGIY
ncbi:hypothetical protein ARMSODRAFT_142402 [Armillaria solidipes]|uniref:Uncharacterized protein n=1 Tax=Armillaria solidipes TaxID=1076256 RepID=A0A2H3BYM2_9AGAR|nr:hypothetical protein ARMSODRAFT_142402 [Armillaria solidipes]